MILTMKKLIDKIKMEIDAIGAQGIVLITTAMLGGAFVYAGLYILYKIVAWII